MLTTFGLAVICNAWFYQLYLLANKKEALINPSFVGIYMVGVLSLVVDGLVSGPSTIAWLNLVSFVSAAGVLVALINKK